MSTNLITLSDPRSQAADAYRQLRTNLIFAGLDEPVTCLVVSSPLPVEDKSPLAANLSVVLAQAGQQVILVDADLRRPRQHTLFEVPSEPGLTTWMAAQDEQAPLPLVDGGVDGLRLLPSGPLPPNPADVLASRKMERLLARCREQADMVVVDAPPVLVAADTSALAVNSDGVLLVVRRGHTRRDHVAQVKDALARAHVRLLGAVLTDAETASRWTAY